MKKRSIFYLSLVIVVFATMTGSFTKPRQIGERLYIHTNISPFYSSIPCSTMVPPNNDLAPCVIPGPYYLTAENAVIQNGFISGKVYNLH